MGVNLRSLVPKTKVDFKTLSGKIVAIDAYNALYQFLAIIRQPDGTPLTDRSGKITSHLSGLFYRTANLVESRIRPIYAFDGKPHLLKSRTLEMRQNRKVIAEKEWKEALEAGDLKRAKSKAQQTSRVTKDILKQSKQLLEALGIPYIQAPSEGEAQASYLVKKGEAFAVGSQDYDCLLVGSPVLIRNLTSSQRRKLPGKEAYSKVYPNQIRLKQNLKSLGLNQKQLVDMAILIGTDFNEGIKGIGPKKSLNLIKKNGNVENVLATIGNKDAPTFEEIKEIRKIFLNPEVTDDYSIEWTEPDNEKVIKILVDNHQFTLERVEPILEKFSSIKNMMKQKTLF